MRFSLEKSLTGLLPSFMELHNYLTVLITVLGLETVLKNAERLEQAMLDFISKICIGRLWGWWELGQSAGSDRVC